MGRGSGTDLAVNPAELAFAGARLENGLSGGLLGWDRRRISRRDVEAQRMSEKSPLGEKAIRIGRGLLAGACPLPDCCIGRGLSPTGRGLRAGACPLPDCCIGRGLSPTGRGLRAGACPLPGCCIGRRTGPTRPTGQTPAMPREQSSYSAGEPERLMEDCPHCPSSSPPCPPHGGVPGPAAQRPGTWPGRPGSREVR